MAEQWPFIWLIDSEPAVYAACAAAIQAAYPGAAVRLVQDHAAAPFAPTPDFIVLDHRVESDPLVRIRQLHARFPATPILALLPVERDDLAAAALAAGAADYLMKTPRVHLRLPLLIDAHLQRRAERQQLAASRQEYRHLFDNAPIGLFRCSPAGELLAVNPMFAATLGAETRCTLIGQPITAFYCDPNDAQPWHAAEQQGGSPITGEIQMRRCDGVTIWVRLRADAVADPATNSTFYEGFLEEISQQRLTEAALRASEAKLRLIFEHAFDGISIYEELPETGSRRLLECNERYAEISGFSRETLMQIGNTSTVQEKMGRVFTRAENLLIRQSKTPYRGFFSWQRPDGKPNVVEYTAAPIDVAGRPLTIGIDRDITQLVEVQETALRRAAHLEALNSVIAASAAAVTIPELLEQTAQQLVAALQAESAVLCVQDAIAAVGVPDAAVHDWAQAIQEDHTLTAQPGADGASHQLLSAPIVHAGRRVGGFVVAAKQDATWLEDVLALADSVGRTIGAAVGRLQLLSAERERQQRSEEHGRLAAVGQLAAGIAHDFNNILAVILLLAQLTRQEKTISEKARSRLQTIIEQTQYAAELVRQILDFSRQSSLTRTRGNLATLLDETAALLRRTLPENIQIVAAHTDADFTIEADFPRLKQVLLNLAVNAQDAMPTGGVLGLHLERIHCAPAETPPLVTLHPGDWFKLTVTDTGVGIAAHVLPRIFEPFFTTKEVGKGTGLGLAQAYGIVKQHAGEIAVESRELNGTRFTIYLPAPETQRITIFAPSASSPVRTQSTLLYVEDDAVLRGAVCDVLESQGYRVLTAGNGEEALTQYGELLAEVDLVITDLSLDGMSGLDLHHSLRQRQPRIRTLIVSGYPDQAGKTQAGRITERADGIVGWLQKPVSLPELLAAIQQALPASRG